MNAHTRTRNIRRAITWIGGGALSALLLVPAANAGPLDDLRQLHRMHRRVHQEVRREVSHTVRHVAGGDRHHRRNRGHDDRAYRDQRRHRGHDDRGDRHHRGHRGHYDRREIRHVPPGHVRHRQHYRQRPHHVDRRFHVPPRIERRYAERYEPYYEGSVWFEPHGHRHDVYDFPVATSRGYGYEPHYYCEGSRFQLEYDSPRLRVNVGF